MNGREHGKLVWLVVFMAIGVTAYSGASKGPVSKTASDYFIAGRGIGLWVFVLAATATSLAVGPLWPSGNDIQRRLAYAFASFYAITIPFTGSYFKRQWLLGKRFGYITPGGMFGDYYRGDAMRLLTVVGLGFQRALPRHTA